MDSPNLKPSTLMGLLILLHLPLSSPRCILQIVQLRPILIGNPTIRFDSYAHRPELLVLNALTSFAYPFNCLRYCCATLCLTGFSCLISKSVSATLAHPNSLCEFTGFHILYSHHTPGSGSQKDVLPITPSDSLGGYESQRVRIKIILSSRTRPRPSR